MQCEPTRWFLTRTVRIDVVKGAATASQGLTYSFVVQGEDGLRMRLDRSVVFLFAFLNGGSDGIT